jgi:PilZ domain
MRTTSISGDTVQQPDAIDGERRNDRRYDIKLDVRWKLIRRRRVMDSGVGYTFDLSRGGIRFHAGCILPVGLNVELSVAWPARLHNVAAMQLSIQGRIVRSADGWSAIRTVQHEFRTMGVPPGHRQPLPNMGNTPVLLMSHAAGHGLRKLQ